MRGLSLVSCLSSRFGYVEYDRYTLAAVDPVGCTAAALGRRAGFGGRGSHDGSLLRGLFRGLAAGWVGRGLRGWSGRQRRAAGVRVLVHPIGTRNGESGANPALALGDPGYS